MVECEHCADDVFSVWRYRERGEEMTHCDPVWVCGDCHPDLTGPVTDRTPESATADGERSTAY